MLNPELTASWEKGLDMVAKKQIQEKEFMQKLEKYINSQADTIRENVRDYSLKISAIDTFEKYSINDNLISYSNKDKANYILVNNDSLGLTDMEKDDIGFYISNNLYNYSYYEIKEMREYVEQNEIYTHVEDVYTPNGIEIDELKEQIDINNLFANLMN